MNNNLIENVATGTTGHQATNKDYVDNNLTKKFDVSGGMINGSITMAGAIIMNNHAILNLRKNITLDYEVVHKTYVDDIYVYVSKKGDTLVGDLNMGNHKITNVQFDSST